MIEESIKEIEIEVSLEWGVHRVGLGEHRFWKKLHRASNFLEGTDFEKTLERKRVEN